MDAKDAIKDRVDVAELIGEFLTLKPAGSGSFKALCPFHQEKSPSFHISTEKQIWHCFGCQKGGDVYAFLMEMEGLSFREALERLSQRTGIPLPQYKRAREESDTVTFLRDLHELATLFYETLLQHPEHGKEARAYIEQRGIPQELVKKFRLGYAADRWDGLVTVMRKRGFGDQRLIDSGLAKPRKSGQGIIDRFRGRLMIPLMDTSGRVIGFTGRILVKDDKAPKYMNSPETALYQKREVLFGLAQARHAIRLNDRVIVVEGNLDVIASHKAGVEEVVASSGTALTEAQLSQLKKRTKHILFAFDQDAAGFEAARKGIRTALALGFEISVIQIDPAIGKDPDDVVQKDPEAWQRMVASPIPIMQYYLDRIMQGYDPTDARAKSRALHFLLQELALFQDAILVDHWLSRMVDIFHTSREALQTELAKLRPASTSAAPVNVQMHRGSSPQQEKKRSRQERLSEIIIGFAIGVEGAMGSIDEKIGEKTATLGVWEGLYKKLQTLYTASSTDSTQQTPKALYSQLCDQLTEEGAEQDVIRIQAATLRAEQLIADLSRNQVRDELNQHIQALIRETKAQERSKLEAAIREAERIGDQAQIAQLMQQYSDLLSQNA